MVTGWLSSVDIQGLHVNLWTSEYAVGSWATATLVVTSKSSAAMAYLEEVRVTPHRPLVGSKAVVWERDTTVPITTAPQIFWSDGSPWREANLWLYERSQEKEVKLATVNSNATSLHAYAQWLETQKELRWWTFPERKADRCVVRYRGALVHARDQGEIAPSTAAARMRVAIAFYRWLADSGLIETDPPMWTDRIIGVRIADAIGLQRTLSVKTTDLAIRNRTQPLDPLEDGASPVSMDLRDSILTLARRKASIELYLMLALGFFTGMRLGSICDLRLRTILNAIPHSTVANQFWLSIGPGARPPVATKFSVTGHVLIPAPLLEELRTYMYSPRRLIREAAASEKEDRTLLFLTRYGNRYAKRGVNKSASLNTELHRLRSMGKREGIPMGTFHFHQSRVTFGTWVAETAIKQGGGINAISEVKDLLLHAKESTAMRYVRFVEKNPLRAQLADEYTRTFFRIQQNVEQ